LLFCHIFFLINALKDRDVSIVTVETASDFVGTVLLIHGENEIIGHVTLENIAKTVYIITKLFVFWIVGSRGV